MHSMDEKKSVEADQAEAERKRKHAVKLVPKKPMAAQELEIRQDRLGGIKVSKSLSSNEPRRQGSPQLRLDWDPFPKLVAGGAVAPAALQVLT
jgi:hypothetical protein